MGITKCGPESFIIALIYLDRSLVHEAVYPSSYTIHRLLLTAIMIASRQTSAKGGKEWKYSLFQRVSGLPEAELKILENSMLKLLNFNIEVSKSDIFEYGENLIKYKPQN